LSKAARQRIVACGQNYRWKSREPFLHHTLWCTYPVIYRMAHEKPACRVVDLRPRWSTRRRAGFSCAILYTYILKRTYISGHYV